MKASATDSCTKLYTTTTPTNWSQVGVNAAFLQEVKDDNRQFRELLATAYETIVQCNTPLAGDPTYLAELLGNVRDQLAWHLTLEERLGYVDEVTEMAPRLCQKAQMLQAQHPVLYEQMTAIAELGDDLRRASQTSLALRLDCVRRAYAQFHDELTRHNEEEDNLIIDALYFDIGGGD